MNVFVSGAITDISYVRAVQERLRQAGHTITYDWTHNEDNGNMLAGDADKLRDVSETARRASADIKGVLDCDAYVLCTSNEESGKGMYVELGAALALCVKGGAPKVYLLGKMNHMSVFYFHPSVVALPDVGDLIRALN